MKFICPLCKKKVFRDMRLLISKMFMTKKGYKGYCDKFEKEVIMKKIK